MRSIMAENMNFELISERNLTRPNAKIRISPCGCWLIALSSIDDSFTLLELSAQGQLDIAGEHGHGNGATARVLDALFAADGRLVLTGFDRPISVYQYTEGILLERQIGPAAKEKPGFSALALSPDNRFLVSAAVHAERTDVYEWMTGSLFAQYWGTGFSSSICFHPQGRLVANVMFDQAGSTLRFAQVTKSGLETYDVIVEPFLDLSGLKFSPDGSLLTMIGSYVTAELRTFSFPELVSKYKWVAAPHATQGKYSFRPGVPIFDNVIFSLDSSRLFCPSESGDIVVLHASTGRLLGKWPAHRGPVVSMAVDYETERLISASNDGWIRVWRVPGIAQQAEARSRAYVEEFRRLAHVIKPEAFEDDFLTIEPETAEPGALVERAGREL